MEEDVDLISSALLKERTKPVALFFAYVDVEDYDLYKTDNNAVMNMHSRKKERLAAYLRSKKYPAFSDKDNRIKNPGAIMITGSGIQTPFMEPEVAEGYAEDLQKIINNSGFVRVFGHLNAVEHEQLTLPKILPDDVDEFLAVFDFRNKLVTCLNKAGKSITKEQMEGAVQKFRYTRHPDARMQKLIRKIYGENFIKDCYQEAFDNAKSREEIDFLSIQNKGKYIYSGRSIGCDKHTIHPRNNLESRSGVYGVISLEEAGKYAKEMGFIYVYKNTEGQYFFGDYERERGEKPQTVPTDKSETQINPAMNEYVGVCVYFGNDRYFKVPEEDVRWQAFLEYFRSSLITDNENVYQRRLNMLKNVDENGRAVTYMPIGGKIEDIEVPQDEKFEDMEVYLQSAPSKIRQVLFEELTGLNKYKKKEINRNISPQLNAIYDSNPVPDVNEEENETANEIDIDEMIKTLGWGKENKGNLMQNFRFSEEKDMEGLPESIIKTRQKVKDIINRKQDENNNRPDITNIKEINQKEQRAK